jgi:hypothetical protein
MASNRIGAHVPVTTKAQVVGIHGGGELGPRFMDSVACGATDTCLGVPAFFPFRILLPMLLHMTAGPPCRFVGFVHDTEMLRSQKIAYLETEVDPCVKTKIGLS